MLPLGLYTLRTPRPRRTVRTGTRSLLRDVHYFLSKVSYNANLEALDFYANILLDGLVIYNPSRLWIYPSSGNLTL